MLFVLVALPFSCASQFFKPFDAASRKLYAQLAPPTQGYSLAFDSAKAVGGDSIFFHFGALNDTSTLLVPPCSGWGSPYCYRADRPVWSGTLFRTDNAGTYWLGTDQGDSLTFDFAAPMGDTTVIFEDATQRFAMVKTAMDTMTVLGYPDSAYTYVIMHTDADGAPIASGLDQQPIIVGKALGLIRFFKVDKFPEELIPLMLMGNKEPDLGLHRITSASLHDHQPGDMVQCRSYIGYALPPGQPFRYDKHIFLSRTDTPDSVSYDYAWESFTAGGDLSSGVSSVRYAKHEVLAELPFERFDGGVIQMELANSSSCPPYLWRLSRVELIGVEPCDTAGCWVAGDTGGPPAQSSSAMLLGVGESHNFHQPGIYPMDPEYFDVRNIVYFLRDGMACGSEIHLGVDEAADILGIRLAPNPATDQVSIAAPGVVELIQVLDQAGRIRKTAQGGSKQVLLDIPDLPAGVYHVRIRLEGGGIAHRLFVKVR